MYICVSQNNDGVEDRALYYLRTLHRKRVYRNNYPYFGSIKDFVLFKYKNKKRAQSLCDEINGVYDDNFVPKEIPE